MQTLHAKYPLCYSISGFEIKLVPFQSLSKNKLPVAMLRVERGNSIAAYAISNTIIKLNKLNR